jgi:hypothetical protein
MPELASYRIVFHDGNGEAIAESAASHADDITAIVHAGRHGHPHEMQLWQGDRFVARLPPRTQDRS